MQCVRVRWRPWPSRWPWSRRPWRRSPSITPASAAGSATRQGGVVPGATVTARQTRPTSPPRSVTDGGGRFRFPYLRVGPTSSRCSCPASPRRDRRLTLSVGAALRDAVRAGRRRRRRPASPSAPRRRCSNRRAARSPPPCREAEVADLPLNGRNFLDVALLAPGVAPPNINSTQLFAETSAVPGVGLSVGSQRNLSNSFIVDGLSANDDAAGLSGMPYGVDAVEQFQVVTSGGQAELGRALGGYVNVVTRSGTNQLRGTAYGYFRDDALNARQRAVGHDAADVAAAVRRQPRRADRAAAARSTSPTPSSGGSTRPGFTTISRRQRRHRQRPAGRGRLPGPVGHHRRSTRTRSTASTCWARSTTPSPAATSSACATASTTSPPRTRAAPAA